MIHKLNILKNPAEIRKRRSAAHNPDTGSKLVEFSGRTEPGSTN